MIVVANFPFDRLPASGPPCAGHVHSRIDGAALRRFERLCGGSDEGLLGGLHALFVLLIARCCGSRQIPVLMLAADGTHLGTACSELPAAANFQALLADSRRATAQTPARPNGGAAAAAQGAAMSFHVRLTHRPEETSRARPAGDLALTIERSEAHLALDWSYATDVLLQSTVELLVRRFGVLLEAAICTPEEKAWRLPLLDAEERRWLIAACNNSSSPFHSRTIHELVAGQARLIPEAVALVCRDVNLSYAELNERANRLAHFLRARGVRTQSLVAVCMERTPELVVGVLAILKAGGAYVPLDPRYPPDRLDFMLADSGARWLLTSVRSLRRLDSDVEHVVLDDPVLVDELQSQDCSDPPPWTQHGEESLAYVIYTSGSTGRPKGVCVEHRQAAALIDWAQGVYDADALSGVLAATSICFDLSVFELFVPLCSGGRVLLVDHPVDFAGIADAAGVRLINTVPSAIKALVQERAIAKSVRVLNLAGEALADSVAAEVYRTTAIEALYNLYGPSETTTYSTGALIERTRRGAPSIGRPLTNEAAYVLDGNLEPAPIGVVGELYVGGAGVTRGYWRRPALTAERFIADPFGNVAGARLYKTGDLARWSPKGELEFIGRIDDQVKLRGFRIEPGEIRTLLLELDHVDDAAIAVREDAHGERRLVAYVVPADSDSELVETCECHLAARLPEHMVPAAFVILPSLPLTPNGKVDRAALPEPPAAHAGPYIAPSSPLQSELAELWRQVLRVTAPVGVRSSFFDLGGHSIQAMQLLARIRQQYGVALSMRDLFAAPTVEDLGCLIERADDSVPPGIGRAPSGAELPLSFAQRRLWLTDLLDGGSAHYHLQLHFRLDGELDASALRRSVQAVVDRHGSLRTVIVTDGEEPRQIVREHVDVPFTLTDLSSLPESAREEEMRQIVSRDLLAPFALDRDCMIRVQLVQLSPAYHELLLTVHHIAADGWSLNLLIKEIGIAYEALLPGRQPPFDELPLQYADYALWQRTSMHASELESQAEYWLEQLRGLPAVHGLPLDRARSAQQGLAGGFYRDQVPADLARELIAVCRDEQATLFMGLHAVFAILLARYSGEEDIVVGTPTANREEAQVADLIGFFVNTMVLRSRIAAGCTFLDLLKQSRDLVLEAYSHQQVPFEYLVEKLQPARALSHAPLFQIMLALQTPGDLCPTLPGVTATLYPPHVELAPFDLTLEIAPRDDGLVLDWTYRRELFDHQTIERLSRHFVNLMRSALERPTADIGTLAIMDPAEISQVMRWATGASLKIPGQCVHEIFEEQARRNPRAPAVLDEKTVLSYAELDRRSNRCARLLQEGGVLPEAIVGIYMERTAEMVVAMLAVLKAGGAYLPLDVTLPPARVEFMLTDSAASLVLTNGQWAAQLPAGGSRVVRMDEPGLLDAYGDLPLDSGAGTASAAYVIYTSGSTGQPKGVVNKHGALVNLSAWHADSFGVDGESRCTLIGSIGFDAAVWELWSTLLAGACAVTVDDATRATPHLLADLMRARKITHCFLPTALLEAISDSDALSSPWLRVVLCGGDKLRGYCLPADATARLVNCYGPTEAAVVSTSYEMQPGSPPLIGRPIANVQAYVLNEMQELQPPGVIGELHIAGANLAREYLNAPALTDERFVGNPFNGDPHARLYRTGDFVRMLADGNIEFIGRRDDQVKLRGMRIEPGEIEQYLLSIDGVRSALVVLREDAPDRHQLVGYICARDGRAVSGFVSGVQATLRSELPEHMVPSAIVVLEEFPVTANGKIDRERLPRPEIVDEQPSAAAPRTPLEAALHRIWVRLLKNDRIGVETNFFSAGGNSLLLTRMVHLIHHRLGAVIGVRDVLRRPTIRSLAAVLEEARPPAEEGELQPLPDAGAFELSAGQFRIWYVEQLRATNEHNMPIAVVLHGCIEHELLQRALDCVVDRHESLRTAIVLEQGSPRQMTLASLEVPLRYEDLRSHPEEQIERRAHLLASEQATSHFDLEQPPLMRALLIRIKATEYRLHLTFHHIIFDGWSAALFLEELTSAYEWLAGGSSPTLPKPPGRYADFAAWQLRWLSGEEASAQASFWTRYLRGSMERLPWVGQGVWESDTEDPRTRVSARIGAAVRERLALLGRDTQGTLFAVLYSAFALLLGRLNGQQQVLVGVPVNGRHRQATEGVLGNFLNNLPVRTQWQPRCTFRAYLVEQVANLQHVLSNQDLPFEKILEQAPHLRHEQSGPVFQAFFNMLQAPPMLRPRLFEAQVVAGPEIEPKFDLTMYVEDDGGEIQLTCHYQRALFSPGSVEHMLRQFSFLLEQVAEDSLLPCGQYSLRPKVPEEGRADLEPGHCWIGAVPELFRRQALEQPQAPAIIEKHRQWTYGEVRAACDRVAAALQQQGIGQGDVVCIVASRSAFLAVAMLGVLQTGAAFSLLDPEHPVERMALLAEIVNPARVLFAGKSSAFAPPLVARLEGIAQCVYLEELMRAVDRALPDLAPALIEPQQLACVTFTSGTTGVPKAVAGTHIGIAGYLSWMPQWLQLTPQDRFSLLSGLGHDPLQRDVFSSICIGATLVIPEPDDIAPYRLARWLRKNAITFVHLTPAMVEVLCTTDETHFPDLRFAFVTGDKLRVDTVRKLLEYNSAMCVLNSYGTTETQRATTYFVASGGNTGAPLVPVGESSPDTVLRVLNDSGVPCGLGEIGDLVVESHSLSCGYRNDPQLTAKVFSDLPDGRRRYRTGDIGCRRPGGIILPLGRKDTQVKVRGFRVEPGEVEVHLRNCAGVRKAAVVALQRREGENELVAYIVPEQAAPDESSLRAAVLDRLRSSLPSYMLPAAIMAVDELPLTPNGKLDRSALPEPVWSADGDRVEPRSELERVLADIWKEVLGLQQVGVEDDFFALGGHSVLMVLLLTRMRERLGTHVHPAKILSCTTVAQQARALSTLDNS